MKTLLTITKEQDGLTLKQLFKMLGYSTIHVKHLKFNPDGGIKVNGKVVTVRYVVHQGDTLELTTKDKFLAPHPNSPKAKVIYQDQYLYVAEKPEGVPSHPDRAHHTDTFGHMLAQTFGNFELHIVTRLDLATSGLVLGAFDEVTAEKLSEMQITHQLHKTYYAVCQGEPMPHAGTINKPLKLGDDKTIVADDGKEAITDYQVVKLNDTHALVKLELITGRTHQLRAHLSSIGCPIKGDIRYGAEPSNRVYLHSQSLTFIHPYTGEIMHFESEIPFDL